jgi:nucleoside 2-deoxyribosyltransferase
MTSERQEDIYFAAPLFCKDEKRGNEELVNKIEKIGYSVFLPQRDGIEFAAIPNLTPQKRNKMIFDLDMEKLTGAKIITAKLDGRVPDEGVCGEVACAYMYRKHVDPEKIIVGFKTDTRFLLQEAEINPIILGCLDNLFKSEEELLEFLKETFNKKWNNRIE